MDEVECQNCFRRATVHITEVIPGGSFEVHFCEEHGAEYVAATLESPSAETEPTQRRHKASKPLMRHRRRRFFTE